MISEKTRQQILGLEHGLPTNSGAGIFGADIAAEDAGLVLLPSPFELTTSYGHGTIDGPETIRTASSQLDLYDLKWGAIYKAGIALLPEDPQIRHLSNANTPHAKAVVAAIENGKPQPAPSLEKVNTACQNLNQLIEQSVHNQISSGKFVGLLGGDHSCPFSLIKMLGAKYHQEGFGILHIDAHHDLRKAYEGFTYSHASIMYNVIQNVPAVHRLVSVAIRDFSQDEHRFAAGHDKITTFYDSQIFQQLAEGTPFKKIAEDIISRLPQLVYISFDIDGLSPENCPSTGTPVPGGLSFQQAIYLIEKLYDSGKTIIGFDLTEVSAAPEQRQWDGNVGARILYKLCGALIRSQKLPDLV